MSPLHSASQNGHADVVEALIRAGSRVDSETTIGSTSLHEAAIWGHVETLVALVGAGANLNKTEKARERGKGGITEIGGTPGLAGRWD